MYNSIFDFKEKTFDENIDNPIKCNLFLATKDSGNLTEENIVKIIKRYGFIKNLVLFHLNDYVDLNNENLLSLIFYHKDFFKFLDFFNKDNILIVKKYFDKVKEDLDKDAQYDIAYSIGFSLAGKSETTFEEFNIILKEILALAINEFTNLEEILIDLWKVWQSAQVSEKSIRQMLHIAKESSGIEYEIIDNYLIAYKGVRKDNTSTISDRTQYFPGITHTHMCDNDITNDNSYGLSAWDYDNAKVYCSDKILKVKIYLKDIRYVNLVDGKLRAVKFEVLEEVE